jgi:hypothetical protein
MTTLQRNRSGLALAVWALLCGIIPLARAQEQTERHVKHPSLGNGTVQGRLAVLEEYYRYPPGSKAIDSSYWDYLHPWNVETQPRPMISQEAMAQIALFDFAGLDEDDIANQVQSYLRSSPLLGAALLHLRLRLDVAIG